MAYGKGRATGYTDFYKGKTRTPGSSVETEEETNSVPQTAEERKKAIARRLKRKRM
jgi:hypothetical protein